MKYEFLDEKSLKKEPFKLKDGVDPATVDWEEERKQFILLRDGIRDLRIKMMAAIEKKKARNSELSLQPRNNYEI